MTKFYSIGAFPKVVGAIDGMLIPIRAAAKEEHLYVCHKGFHAINEENYQRSHTRTRNVIERSFGLLKQRFRFLDLSGGTMQFSPSSCCDIIVAT